MAKSPNKPAATAARREAATIGGNGRVRVAVDLPEQIYRELRDHAKSTGTTISALCRDGALVALPAHRLEFLLAQQSELELLRRRVADKAAVLSCLETILPPIGAAIAARHGIAPPHEHP